MAHAAISQLIQAKAADVVLLYELGAALLLVGWRLPFHVVELVSRPQLLLRRFVAVQAPAHIQRVGFPRQRHLIHAAMAGRAPDSFLDVDGVAEEDKVGQVVDSLPMDWLTPSQTFTHGCKNRRIGPNL